LHFGPRLDIERCGKRNAVNSLSDSCTGIGVVAGYAVVVLILQGPHMKQGDTHWRITLLHILQEVVSICKTRNHLLVKQFRVTVDQNAHSWNGGQQQTMVIRGVCPRCKSAKYKKNGHIHNSKQNYHCHDCGRQFVQCCEQYLISEDKRGPHSPGFSGKILDR
jgi:hypothetical protein